MKVTIFWFRRDLRLDDNAGLYQALKSGYPVVPVFIFDTNILNDLQEKADKRVAFIHNTLQDMQKKLRDVSASLHVLHDKPLAAYQKLLKEYEVQAVYTNTDYEPYARQRDEEIAKLLLENNIPLYSYKDQVIFEKNEVIKDNAQPYSVYTPYSRRWKEKLNPFYLTPYPCHKYFDNFRKHKAIAIPALEDIGFTPVDYDVVRPTLNETIAKDYEKTRDIPSINGTTRLSVHLRFGTISIRQLAAQAHRLNEKLLNELIWRDFYQMILWHYPNIVTESFHQEYDNIKWRNNEHEFQLWCAGNTGYPIVDAGMRELNETGYMHNRVRMVVASFLTKHLLIDWRWGEAYFGSKLLDYDLASNNGGWQWAAGSGCDAAPYFRIFNPYLQTKKFDPEFQYIRKWVPEFESPSYPRPMVAHDEARKRCLTVYKAAIREKMK